MVVNNQTLRAQVADSPSSGLSSEQMVATVVKTVGKVVAIDTQGNVRQLKPGDVVYRNEKIVTEEGESIELRDANGVTLTIGPMSFAVMDGCNFEDLPIVVSSEGETYLSSDYAYGTFDAVIFDSGASDIVLTGSLSGEQGDLFLTSEEELITGDDALLATLPSILTPTTITVGSSTPTPLNFPGFVINGLGGNFGTSVSFLGDINGDGFGDFAIGAPGNTTYILFGSNNALEALDAADGSADSFLNLSFLDGTNGFQLKAGTDSGFSVSFVGDVNGDGESDFMIGSETDNESWLVFGGSSQLSILDLTDDSNTPGVIDFNVVLEPELGFQFQGGPGENAGSAVNYAGDINLDGFGDFYIASSATDTVYLLFGGGYFADPTLNMGNNLVDLTSIGLSNPLGYVIQGAGGALGTSIGFMPDTIGEGPYGLIIGAPITNVANNPLGVGPPGQVYYLIDGINALETLDTVNFTQSPDLHININDLRSTDAGITFTGLNGDDLLGAAVSTAGDTNADGVADLLFSAPGVNDGSGAVYLISGHIDNILDLVNFGTDLATLPEGLGNYTIFGVAGSSTGASLSYGGDFNGDGFGDIIIGAPDLGASGTTYVVFGGTFLEQLDAADDPNGLVDTNISLSNFVDGEHGFIITGLSAGDDASSAVRAAGDVNGDGFADILVGAPNANAGAGQAYIVYGFDANNQVTHMGTQGADILTGTSGNDIFVGDQGNDTLISNGGVDTLIGGAGNDLLVIQPELLNPADPQTLVFPRQIDGGTGDDTLRIEGDGLNISFEGAIDGGIEDDPFGLLKVVGIDILDLNSSGAVSIEINLSTLIYMVDSYVPDSDTGDGNLPFKNALTIEGNNQDTVNLDSNFSQVTTQGNYDVYQEATTGITLAINNDVNVNTI